MDLYQSLVTVNPVTLIAQICNLFIQLLIVKIFFLDKIKAVLDKRRETADKQIADAEAAKSEAAAAAWLAAKGDDQALCVEKLELVDYAYQELLTDEADDLLDVAGCADIHRFWGSEPVESIEAIMQAAGLRG